MPTSLSWTLVAPPTPGSLLVSQGSAGQGLTDPLGVDVICLPNLSPTLSLESGVPVVASALVRRLSTPAGGLFYDPNYGLDVQNFLNDSSADSFEVASQISEECEKDERVASANVQTLFQAGKSELDITVSITLKTGQAFTLVLNVAQVTTDLLDAAASS
jgi:hypothetical protein